MTTAAPAAPHEEIDHVSGEVIETTAGALLSPAARAEIDQQIATAKRHPRSIAKFKKQALQLATLTEDTAASCMYALPRGGKPIEGPSVRLAEIVASAWGNFRVDSRIIDTDDRFITAEAAAWDLENNVAIRVQVRRRITNKSGTRYNDDMIGVTGNAAIAIALRNAIFKVVPHALTQEIYAAAREVAIGNASTLAGNRAKMIEYFGKMGAPIERVLAVLGKAGIEDVTLDDLGVLRGLASAIKSGDTTVDQAFPDPKAQPPKERSGAAHVADVARQQLDALEEERTTKPAPEATRPPTAEEQARRAQGLRLVNGCTPGENGCSTEVSVDAIGKKRCSNHAAEAVTEKPAAEEKPTEDAGSGALPGMGTDAPTPSNRPTRGKGR